ncbi:MAG: hypothetical protein EOP58_02240, partial [Sphingomonadales bacterium]
MIAVRRDARSISDASAIYDGCWGPFTRDFGWGISMSVKVIAEFDALLARASDDRLIADRLSVSTAAAALNGLTPGTVDGKPNNLVTFGSVMADPPVLSTNNGSTLLEGGTDTVTAGELTYADADTDAAAVVYTITSASTNGTLLLGGAALGLNDSFTQADLDSGLVTYAHDGGETTDDSFGFSVSDGTTTLTDQTFVFTVTPVNDAPTLTGLTTSLTVGENAVNAAPVLIDADVTFADIDSGDLADGTLFVDGLLAEDRVAVRNQGIGAGEIGVSGSDITFGGVVIGSFTGGVGAALIITFNSDSTVAAVEALLENLTYANVSDTPTPSRTLT